MTKSRQGQESRQKARDFGHGGGQSRSRSSPPSRPLKPDGRRDSPSPGKGQGKSSHGGGQKGKRLRLDRKVLDQRRKAGVCLWCGKPGHQFKTCYGFLNLKKARPARRVRDVAVDDWEGTQVTGSDVSDIDPLVRELESLGFSVNSPAVSEVPEDPGHPPVLESEEEVSEHPLH